MFGLDWLAMGDDTMAALLVLIAHLVLALGTSIHILVTKDRPRSAAGWAALTWLSPFIGTVAYAMLGVNRVQRKAHKMRRGEGRPRSSEGPDHDTTQVETLGLSALKHALDRVTDAPLLGGSRILPLDSGEAAYPAMLEAIEGAEKTIGLMTFIFDNDPWGVRFVDALAAAKDRGVEVRVLIDGVGSWFSWPPIMGRLRRAGVPYERFLWSWNPWRMALINLRNHRKVMVVDGTIGFTGGMNLRGSFVQASDDHPAHRDVHAKVEGPLVRELVDLFADDWFYEAGEVLEGDGWYPEIAPAGDGFGRVIPDGPDEDLGKAELTFLAAIACATASVKVISPYFLPEPEVQAMLIAAALRGVDVDVIVPGKSNQPMAAWAMMADISPMLERGVRIWAQVPPFDHSKMMIVDGRWSAIGSANWDPRSLRLNFEMLLEVYGTDTAEALGELFDAKLARSVPLTAAGLRQRPLWKRTRDGAARLFKPYL